MGGLRLVSQFTSHFLAELVPVVLHDLLFNLSNVFVSTSTHLENLLMT